MAEIENLEKLALEILHGSRQPEKDILNRIIALSKDLYENDPDHTIVDDNQYDVLCEIFRTIDPDAVILREVGSDVRAGKVKLPYSMYSITQIQKGNWASYINNNKWQDETFVASVKLDGVSALACYGEDGRFENSYSRGNGDEGAVTTRHFRNIPNIPMKLPHKTAIRGEIIMPNAMFQKLKKQGLIEGKNSRNYVAGRMNAKMSPKIFYDNVVFIATSVVDPDMNKKDQFEFLKKYKFLTPDYMILSGRDIANELELEDFLTKQKASSIYLLDGIVVDHNDRMRYGNKTTNDPNKTDLTRKYKLGGIENITAVKRVIWEASKDGRLIPRIEVHPVDIDGVTVTFISGQNARFILRNKIGPGAVIGVTRRGDVIPYVESIITSAEEASMPSEVEYGKMVYSKSGVDLLLVDIENNPIIQKNVIVSVFSMQFGLEVDGLREASAEKLVANGLVTPTSIIKATKAQLQTIVGRSAGETIFNSLRAKLNPIPLWQLAGASQTLGRGIGMKRVQRLLEVLPNMADWTIGNIVKVEGFDAITANIIVDNLPRFYAFLEDIKGFYTLDQPKAKVEGGPLTGKSFVFTGFRDKDAESKIKELGGEVLNDVNKNTTYVVTKDANSTSGKIKKAKNLGAKIINPAELATLL